MQRLEQCPACDSSRIDAVFPGLTGDNTLARLVDKPLPFALPGFDLGQHATSDWHVCRHCRLLFARNRPDDAGLAAWYPQLFQHSEERHYNTPVLPADYLESKARGARALFRQLDELNLFDNAKTLLHLRTGPGHLLAFAREAYPKLEAYGLEYFKHPADHARKLVGDDRIEVINVPEPVNPFGVRHFDVIIANHFFTHAHHPQAFARYLHGLLAPEGRLIIYNELDHALSLRSMSAYARGLNFFHKQLWTRATFHAFLMAQGFSVADISEAKNGRMPKYMTVVCKKSEAVGTKDGDSASAVRLLRRWRNRHRFYKLVKPVVVPVRKLLGL